MSEETVDVCKAAELIQCAILNVDNIRKIGTPMIAVVKLQLNEALIALGEEPMPEIPA